jgi:hypothetical protein
MTLVSLSIHAAARCIWLLDDKESKQSKQASHGTFGSCSVGVAALQAACNCISERQEIAKRTKKSKRKTHRDLLENLLWDRF